MNSFETENYVLIKYDEILCDFFILRECVRIAKEKEIIEVPSLAWFLLQFWPTSRTTSKMLNYTGRFKVRRMVQARLLRKQNIDSHYASAIYKFIKTRAINNSSNVAFFSADAKCKVSIGEPDYPIAAVSRGRQVIVAANESFKVADHDFTKLSMIPDAYLIHEIPQLPINQGPVNEREEEELDISESTPSLFGQWYTGQVFYGFKNIVLQGSTAMRCAAEMGKIAKAYYGYSIPPRWYAYTGSGPERKVDNLSVQKAYISMFLINDLDEFLVCWTAANQSY